MRFDIEEDIKISLVRFLSLSFSLSHLWTVDEDIRVGEILFLKNSSLSVSQ